MPMTREKFQKLFDDRVHNILCDGYYPYVSFKDDNLYLCKMKHGTNGNRVKVVGYPKRFQLEQWTNGKLKFIANYK